MKGTTKYVDTLKDTLPSVTGRSLRTSGQKVEGECRDEIRREREERVYLLV